MIFNFTVGNNISGRLFVLILVVILVPLLLIVTGIVLQDLVLVYSLILFILLLSYFGFQDKVNIFNPFTLFTMYYFTIIPAALYLYYTHYNNSLYIGLSNFGTDLDALLQASLLYSIIGYSFAFFGYKTFEKAKTIIICFDDRIPIVLINFSIIIFAAIGIFNFIYNVAVFAGGNPLEYFSNISNRNKEFEEIGGTTLGYHFCYSAAYLWFYKMLKFKKFSYIFIIYLVTTIFIKATAGRVASTLFYTLTFVSAYYIFNLKQSQKYNYRYLLYFIGLGAIGILFYFFRITSSLANNNMLSESWLNVILSSVNFDTIMFFAVDKGNVPNIAILMQIIDSWGRDIGFLYGKTFVTWLYSIIPISLRPEGYQISVMISKNWYPTLVGSLPPTGIGEMYANFGVLGPFIGMYMFGCFVAAVHNLLFKFNNYWYLIIYSNISLYFIMLYSKGEFDNMSLWHILPMLMTYLYLKLITKFFALVRHSNRSFNQC